MTLNGNQVVAFDWKWAKWRTDKYKDFEIFSNNDTPLLNVSSITFGIIWIGMMLGSLIILRNILQINRN